MPMFFPAKRTCCICVTGSRTCWQTNATRRGSTSSRSPGRAWGCTGGSPSYSPIYFLALGNILGTQLGTKAYGVCIIMAGTNDVGAVSRRPAGAFFFEFTLLTGWVAAHYVHSVSHCTPYQGSYELFACSLSHLRCAFKCKCNLVGFLSFWLLGKSIWKYFLCFACALLDCP